MHQFVDSYVESVGRALPRDHAKITVAMLERFADAIEMHTKGAGTENRAA
jgi:hypothetical protein